MSRVKSPTPHLRASPTRAKILKSARDLFVEFGFDGVSIGTIAKKARINHSLIFHHFGNKQNLWKAVKQNIVAETNTLSPTLPELNQPFSAFLKQLVTLNISFYRNNPDIIRMISWQRLEHKNKNDIGVTLSLESKLWLAALKHYQEKGEINGKLKLEFVLTYILSVISSAAIDPNIFIKENPNLDSYCKFLVEMLLKSFS
ncbi:MAG: TetR/AcrR family transcriptional regulator [Gammaproteobacteria bacterium]|nr:TetR/AcrR family transcriptional regulator [Gammaproteobacteria bacterium]MCW5582418.1 TetR/AcrR family transcriptional regulator [Gammaproteobacteria bacterium]